MLAGGSVAAQVPTFAEISGHDFGVRITVHHQMAAYLEALATSSPRVTVVDQGSSWEGRRLLLAVVTSPANHARRDVINFRGYWRGVDRLFLNAVVLGPSAP